MGQLSAVALAFLAGFCSSDCKRDGFAKGYYDEREKACGCVELRDISALMHPFNLTKKSAYKGNTEAYESSWSYKPLKDME